MTVQVISSVDRAHYQLRQRFLYSRENSSPQWGAERHKLWPVHAFHGAVAVNSHGEIYVSEYGVVERLQRFGFTLGCHEGKAASA